MAVGIIAEYNPFHAGHAHQIAQIKKITDEEIIAVMSGSFTQRGSPTILDKWTRAKSAILGGVDLVFELPFVKSVRSAENFAIGGIKLLQSLSVVKKLAFGAEIDDLAGLKLAARAFDAKNFKARLLEQMNCGKSYAAAATKILSEESGLGEEILRRPNNILAIEYLRALPEEISPLLIKRIGAGYDDSTLREEFSSASAIRAALYETNPLWEKISAQVSNETLKSLRAEKLSGLVDENLLFRPIIAKILTSRADKLKKIYGMGEGLEFSLIKAAAAKNFSELVASLTGKRYPASRIRRLLLYFLLNVTVEEILELDGVTCARVLAFNERGRKLLKKISAPIVTRVTKHLNRRDLYERRRILEPYQKILLFDVLASDLRGILFETPRPLQQDFSTAAEYVR